MNEPVGKVPVMIVSYAMGLGTSPLLQDLWSATSFDAGSWNAFVIGFFHALRVGLVFAGALAGIFIVVLFFVGVVWFINSVVEGEQE